MYWEGALEWQESHLVAGADRGACVLARGPDDVAGDVPAVEPPHKPRVHQLVWGTRVIQLMIANAVGIKGNLLEQLEEDLALGVGGVRDPAALTSHPQAVTVSFSHRL